ncbi:RICIN domain-containing protein [Actinoplanes sp. RD1]|uniref:RICIN domain-containing protein n=1 Tax=Actinoplanes sp. RD1 TaxID=3064538 RepID=UPI0027425A9F|nr:RICIN domain-containing protein [Actinoplanes sp. RD1]
MSAHRRLALRGEAPKGRLRRWLPLALGVAMLGVGGVVGPGMVTGTLPTGGDDTSGTATGLPADNRGTGMVFAGLRAPAEGSLCSGTYVLDTETCTTGPDTAPAGLAVGADVAPVTAKLAEPADPAREAAVVPADAEVIRDEGGVALSATAPALIPDFAPGDADFVMGPHDVACAGDGRGGKRVQTLYLHEYGTPSRFTDYLGSIRTWTAGVDQIFDASAAETGGSRHLRYVTTPSCQVDVAEVQLPAGSLASFPATIAALQTLGYNRTDRKYLMFADANVYCGIASYVPDNRRGSGNRNNGGPSYGRVDAGCWSSAIAATETTRMLGAVLQGSPNATGAGRCTDDHDLLCGPDRSGKKIRSVCPPGHELLLDCGHDDYFSTDPEPESWLDKNWNVALSEFLLRGDGGDDVPDAPNAPAPASAAPSVPPGISGGIADGGGDGVAPSGSSPVAAAAGPVQAVLEVRDQDTTSVQLLWSAAAPEAKYEVDVDGVKVATTSATRARLVGLRPGTKYTVVVRSAATKYAAKGVAQSAPTAQPAANAWFVLSNSLTGGSADLYAARDADGTPITLGDADGDAQEQWQLVPAGADTFSLRSQASGKCVVPLGGNPVAGAPLVQGDCGRDDGRWRLFATPYGFSLRTDVGGLAAGVGAQRYGWARLLVLQKPDQARHQSWTAVPG